MNKEINAYVELAKTFHDQGYALYLVGGTVRDFFLNVPLSDMDLVTDATPEEMKCFLEDADFTFAKFGSIKYSIKSVKFDITTLRVEKSYKDNRHPAKVKFVTSLKKDVKRRDFTINGLYLDDRFQLYDFVKGKNDLNNKIIRAIGNPSKRLKEDPLRILRAIRFALNNQFIIEPKLDQALIKYSYLVERLNKDKIKQELSKIRYCDPAVKENFFKHYGLDQLL